MRLHSIGIPFTSQGRFVHGSLVDTGIYFLMACYGLLALIALALVPLHFLPAEDAVILFQYSRNLAEHGAITFLAQGGHVEGATDFAWMALVAFGLRLHLPAFWFCAGVNTLALIALGYLLLRLADQRLSILRLLAVMGAISLVPQIVAAGSGFAVLPDAVLLTSLALVVKNNRPAAAAILAFVFCLFRPDGVIFAVPFLLSLLGPVQSRFRNAAFISVLFVGPGLLYFAWRWLYFSEFLPLPFLVKADTHRVAGLFVPLSVHQSVIYLVFTLVLILFVGSRPNARYCWFLIPLAGLPTLFYWAMRLDQNVAARFFFYLPLSAAIFIALNWKEGAHKIGLFRIGIVAWLLLLAMPLAREVRTFRDEQFSNVRDIAIAFSHLPRSGSVLTSEAGYIPYFSGWTTYDAWGLNTPRFAHRFIQHEDVDALQPDLIVLHPDRTDSCLADPLWPANYQNRTWSHMTRNLVLAANPDSYELWLTSYGSDFYRRRKHWRYGEGDRECWFVKKNSSIYLQITSILETHYGVPPNVSLQLEREHNSLSP